MLPERVFLVGGGLSVGAGGLLIAAFVLGPSAVLWADLEAAGLLIAFGLFFVYVGRGAREDRRRLLESPRPPA